MVAEYGVDAVACFQRTENVHMGIYVFRLDVLQVTSEDNHIWLLGVNAVDGPLQHPFVVLHVTTYVGIREKHDTVAIEGGWYVF